MSQSIALFCIVFLYFAIYEQSDFTVRGIANMNDLWKFNSNPEVDDFEDAPKVRTKVWLRSVFRETGLEGIPLLIREGGVLKKLFWIAAIGFCAFGLQWELDAFFSKFLSWKATSAVSIETARTLPFPAVTLCNNNPVTLQWDKTHKGKKQKKRAAGQEGHSGGPPEGQKGHSGRSSEGHDGGLDSILGGGDAPEGSTSYAENMKAFLEVQGRVSQIPYDLKSEAGHPLCDMVFEMQYAGVELKPSTAMRTWHWNEFYGNCYTFNPGLNKSESPATSNDTWTIKVGGESRKGVKSSTKSGDKFGLYLLLNADVENYMTHTKQVGWRIVIHNQTVMPLPQESGVVIQPGTSNYIGVTLKYMKKLGTVDNGLFWARYSGCVDRDDLVIDDPFNAYSNKLEVSYTRTACMYTCYQQYVMRRCGCFDLNYANEGLAFQGIRRYGGCLYSNTSAWNCKLRVAASFYHSELECDCPETCKSYSYSTVISNLGWPHAYAPTLKTLCQTLAVTVDQRTQLNDSNCVGTSNFPATAAKDPERNSPLGIYLKDCASSNFDIDRISYEEFAKFTVGHRFAEVFIYYRDFNYETVIESPMMEIPDLLAFLGGILGLFFGFTFVTLFEYIQLFFDLIILGFSYFFWPKKREPPNGTRRHFLGTTFRGSSQIGYQQ